MVRPLVGLILITASLVPALRSPQPISIRPPRLHRSVRDIHATIVKPDIRTGKPHVHHVQMSAAPSDTPPWVSTLNSALEVSGLCTLLAFLVVDVTATCLILAALVALRVPVAADFALALALSKAMRGPRFALDASLAALLTRRFPALKAVKITLCLDEFAASWSEVQRSFNEGIAEGQGRASTSDVVQAALPPGFTPRPGKLEAAALAARKLTADYGLAYMAAKNIVALSSVLLTLGALRSGGPARAATAALMRMLRASAGAGAFAGQVALAVTLHYTLFPLVVLAAAKVGPRISASVEASARRQR